MISWEQLKKVVIKNLKGYLIRLRNFCGKSAKVLCRENFCFLQSTKVLCTQEIAHPRKFMCA